MEYTTSQIQPPGSALLGSLTTLTPILSPLEACGRRAPCPIPRCSDDWVARPADLLSAVQSDALSPLPWAVLMRSSK